jgi:hypothetical protein
MPHYGDMCLYAKLFLSPSAANSHTIFPFFPRDHRSFPVCRKPVFAKSTASTHGANVAVAISANLSQAYSIRSDVKTASDAIALSTAFSAGQVVVQSGRTWQLWRILVCQPRDDRMICNCPIHSSSTLLYVLIATLQCDRRTLFCR